MMTEKEKAIRALPYRKGIVYCAYNGVDFHRKCNVNEISKVLGITKSRVYQILKEATSMVNGE